MPSKTENIFQGTVSYLTTKITEAQDVRLSFVDERGEGLDDSASYPLLLVSMYDESFDSTRRVSGLRNLEDLDDDTWRLHGMPIPINGYFQIDLLTKTYEELWTIGEKLKQIFGERWSKFTVPNENIELYIIPEGIIPLSGIENDGIHRVSYRYYVEYWLDSLETPVDIPKIKKISIDIPNSGDQDVEVI